MPLLKPSIAIILGSIRKGRKSPHVTRLLVEYLEKSQKVNVKLLDLAALELPLLEVRYDQMEEPIESLSRFHKTNEEVSAVIVVSPEYKNGIPGVLKNALDFLNPGIWYHKPIGIVSVSSGGFGGLDCLQQLRKVSLALGGSPIPAKLAVSHVQSQFNNEGACISEKLPGQTDLFVDEFLWYVDAFQMKKEKEVVNTF